MNYRLQNRYQDSGWEDLRDEQFHAAREAIRRASKLSQGGRGAMIYGMVRVVRNRDGAVMQEFAAGHS